MPARRDTQAVSFLHDLQVDLRTALVDRAVRAIAVLCSPPSRSRRPEPKGAHPRMLLDAELKAAWQADARRTEGRSRVRSRCARARDTAEHDRALYQGAQWAKVLQACLVHGRDGRCVVREDGHPVLRCAPRDLDASEIAAAATSQRRATTATRSETSGPTRRSPTTGSTTS